MCLGIVAFKANRLVVINDSLLYFPLRLISGLNVEGERLKYLTIELMGGLNPFG
jgi:hypothetical protein